MFRFFSGRARRRAIAHSVTATPTVTVIQKLPMRDNGVWLLEETEKLLAAGATIFRSQGSKIALETLPEKQFLYRVLGHSDFTLSVVPLKGREMESFAWA